MASADRASAGEFVAQVNRNLERFGASFRIVDLAGKSSSARVTADFALALTAGGSVKASKRIPTEPRFDTVLSEGDRSALGLAIFGAMVASRKDLAECTIVLDDPFTSLDRNRRAKTCSFATSLAKRVAQLIVLSHDELFLRDVVKACGGAFQRRIRPSGLEEWDAEEHCRAPYARDLELLRAFADPTSHASPERCELVWQLLRPTLEEYLRFRFPRWWQGNQWLGHFVDRARQHSGPHDLPFNDDQLTLLEEWKNFGNPPHHGEGHRPQPRPAEGELKTWTAEIVRFLES